MDIYNKDGKKMLFLFDLDFVKLKALSSIMDSDDSWEELAAGMRDMPSEVVFLCRKCRERHQSPTEQLLRVYSSRGHTVEHLLKVLARIRHVRGMEVLKDCVEKPVYNRLLSKAQPNQNLLTPLDHQKSATNPSIAGSAGIRDPAGVFAACGVSDQVRGGAGSSLGAGSFGGKTSFNNQPQPVGAAPNSSIRSEESNVTAGSAKTTASAAAAAGLANSLSVPYSELKTATNDFDQANLIGKGGYGMVYKAEWKHTTIAVKRITSRHKTNSPTSEQELFMEKERFRQSLIELRILALYRHDNILPLYGYSLDGPEPCLIYQFMAKGSLEDRLLCRAGSNPLTWDERRSIVIGSAKGIHFLHDIRPEPLIHGDIKCANILLNTHLEPKLGDFGLCRQGRVEAEPGSAPPLIASHIKGTLAYLPPEFLRSKHLSTKLDVFSFGVVLFEVATGLRAYSERRKPQNLVDYMSESMRLGSETLISRADEKAGQPPQLDLYIGLVQWGVHCTRSHPQDRPTIANVLTQLTTSST